jgi:ATP-dependent Clp protease adaptor protein ClpS
MGNVKGKPVQSPHDSSTTGNDLVLYNDEVNTFEFVIETLIEVCEHEPEQAEQCAWIAHFKGKCAVKSGPPSQLKPYYTRLGSRGLTVAIE